MTASPTLLALGITISCDCIPASLGMTVVSCLGITTEH